MTRAHTHGRARARGARRARARGRRNRRVHVAEALGDLRAGQRHADRRVGGGQRRRDRARGDRDPDRHDDHDDRRARHEGRHRPGPGERARARRRAAAARRRHHRRAAGRGQPDDAGAVHPGRRRRRRRCSSSSRRRARRSTCRRSCIPTSGGPDRRSARRSSCSACPPPDIPVAAGGATFGAKFLSADLTLNGVFGPVVQGAWVGFWTPWHAGHRPDQRGRHRRLAGRDRARRAHADRAKVERRQAPRRPGDAGGCRRRDARHDLRRGATGALGDRRRLGERERHVHVRRAEAVEGDHVPGARAVDRRPALAAVCSQFGSLGVPCVNPTVSGFTAHVAASSRLR